jgi:hypothetical protein
MNSNLNPYGPARPCPSFPDGSGDPEFSKNGRPAAGLTRSFDQGELIATLRTYLSLCTEILELTTCENRALDSSAKYDPSEFGERRKGLLPRLEQSSKALSAWRKRWQELDPSTRAGFPDAKALFNAVQESLTRILLLDKTNQQALLRLGKVPAQHLSEVAVGQQPPFVINAYRRHARA